MVGRIGGKGVGSRSIAPGRLSTLNQAARNTLNNLQVGEFL